MGVCFSSIEYSENEKSKVFSDNQNMLDSFYLLNYTISAAAYRHAIYHLIHEFLIKSKKIFHSDVYFNQVKRMNQTLNNYEKELCSCSCHETEQYEELKNATNNLRTFFETILNTKWKQWLDNMNSQITKLATKMPMPSVYVYELLLNCFFKPQIDHNLILQQFYLYTTVLEEHKQIRQNFAAEEFLLIKCAENLDLVFVSDISKFQTECVWFALNVYIQMPFEPCDPEYRIYNKIDFLKFYVSQNKPLNKMFKLLKYK